MTTVGDRVWVRWEAEAKGVLRRVMPLPGAEIYSQRGGLWYRVGHHLPTFGLPVEDEGDAIPLYRAVTPEPARVVAPGEATQTPAQLILVRDSRERPATALRCRVEALRGWADSAPTAELDALMAASRGTR